MVVIVLPLPERLIVLPLPANIIEPTASDLISRFVAALTVIVVPADIEVLATLDTVTLFPAPINTSLSKAITE